MTPPLHLTACLLVACLAACDDGGCTLNLVPGVVIEVRDEVTSQYLTTTPHGVLREGTFVEGLEVSEFTDDVPPRVRTLVGAVERAGRYVVQIEADGYLPWNKTGVRVTKDDCHVRTVRFTADLEPVP